VRKPDGSLRLCINYRKLNAVTASYPAVLPLIDEVLDAATGSKRYTKIDLKGAFNLLRMKKGSEWLTTFLTKFGAYQYNVIPFGLKNAPGHFQMIMDIMFGDLCVRGIRCYMDDIIIFAAEQSEHRELVRLVLARLKKHALGYYL
jgi:hypothetical protein